MSLTHSGFELSLRAFIKEIDTGVGANQGSREFEHIFDKVARYERGNGQNRVNAVYSAYSPALSTTGIDLQGGLTNVLTGAAVSFPIIMGIFIANYSQVDAEYLTVGGSTNPFITWLNATGDGVRVYGDGFLALWNPRVGYPTTAGTGDTLTITPATGTPPAAYFLVGRDA